jgi:hypothetical protein
MSPAKLEIADLALCNTVCEEIYRQRPRWRMRRLNDRRPFYTLGSASYLDLGFGGGSLDRYLGDAGSLWSWAGEALRTVMERTRAKLAEHLDGPVEYAPELPSPGFHIFIGAAIPTTDCPRSAEDCASCHFDTQHDLIPWERWYTAVDLRDTISFTLPLKLPAEGAGLMLWESLDLDQMREHLAAKRFADLPSAAQVTPSTTIPYAAGRLVLHNGHVLHQMVGVPRLVVTDERITLQGHGVFADAAWRLYW